jgi:hypothetical protein
MLRSKIAIVLAKNGNLFRRFFAKILENHNIGPRATRLVCEIIAPNLSQPNFCQI